MYCGAPLAEPLPKVAGRWHWLDPAVDAERSAAASLRTKAGGTGSCSSCGIWRKGYTPGREHFFRRLVRSTRAPTFHPQCCSSIPASRAGNIVLGQLLRYHLHCFRYWPEFASGKPIVWRKLPLLNDVSLLSLPPVPPVPMPCSASRVVNSWAISACHQCLFGCPATRMVLIAGYSTTFIWYFAVFPRVRFSNFGPIASAYYIWHFETLSFSNSRPIALSVSFAWP